MKRIPEALFAKERTSTFRPSPGLSPEYGGEE
jgi:hypothetical protein